MDKPNEAKPIQLFAKRQHSNSEVDPKWIFDD